MKINYKNTALNLLDKWDEEINLPEPHKPMTEEEKKKFGNSLLLGLEKSKELFGNNIQYISQPFIEAYQKGKHKLVDVFDKEPMEEAGTFIWQAGSFTHTNFYYLKTYGEGDEWNAEYMFVQFSKHAQNNFKSVDVCVTTNKDSDKTFIWKGHYEKGFDHTHYFAFLITFICFIKHVELETKIIKPESKEWHIGTKYLNETKNKIEILDSTWFTTIVRSEGFNVRGHFRMQPCGKDRAERKLIWISDFEKEGYTREARILNNQNQ
jgi:hypothetical protein